MDKVTYLYAGTYTRPAPYLAQTNGKGIYVFRFDPASGELTQTGETLGIDNPSYLNFDPGKRRLYAISEVLEWPEGLISAYAINPDNGELTYLNKQSSMGWLACYVMVDATNRYVVLSNYLQGNAAMFPIRADGKLGEASDTVQHQGSGIDPARQEGPHAHCIVIDPSNSYAFVADLGIDKIMGYRLDLTEGKFIFNSSVDLPSGSGPRHFVFHPNARFAYSINELASTIAAYSYDSATGQLELLQIAPALPEGYAGHSHCADIHVHPSGRFLYGSNRGHDSIVIYGIDPTTGQLSTIGHEPTLGQTPRNFTPDPSGQYLLVANQDSDTIVTFRIDLDTGRLAPTGHVATCPTPCVLKMVELP
jgi:6-phosphogluconolactonase